MNTTLRTSSTPILRVGVLVFTAILAFAASAMAQEPGKIAYIADEEIWMMEADGSGKEALGLSTTEFRAKGVQLSPDGLWLVFSGNGPGGGTGLYLMKAEPYSDPGNVPSLIGPGASPYKRVSWHPDGRYVAYVKDYFDLYLVEALDGNGQPAAAAPAELISTTTTGGNTFDGCAFDPNGRDILVSQTGAPAKLFQVFDDAGVRTAPGTITTITTAPGDVLWPSFSPDGKKIVFQEATNAFSESAIAVLTIRDENGTLTPENATTNPRVLYTPSTLATTSFVASPTWSPDGSKIAFLFSSDITFRFEIVSISASGPESPSNLRVYLAGANNVNTNYPSFAHPGGGGGSTPITAAPIPPNLISWWPGENAAWDVAGIGEGSMKNSEDFDPYDVGKVGRAFWFDGIDDHVQGSTGLSLNGDFTIEVWVQPEAHSAEAVIVAKGDTADDDVSYSLLLRNGKPWFRSSMGGVEQEIEVGNITYSLPLNQWTHLAFTQNASASRMTFYVNGVLMQQTAAVPPRPNTTGPLTIGAAIDATHPTATPASPFEGLVDELTLYDRALSGTEIQLIVAAGKAGKERHDPARDFSATANPNGLWRFGWIDGDAFDPAFLTDSDPGNGGLFAAPAALDGTTHRYSAPPEAHLLFNKSKTDRADFPGNGGISQISLAPRQFALEESDDGDYSVIQWTAPKTGTYALSGTFTGVEDLPTDAVVYFYVNDAMEFTAGIDSFLGDGRSFTVETDLNEDETCTWFVGNGPTILGVGQTGLVASAVLLEERTTFARPELTRIDFNAPIMDGKTVTFIALNGDKSANSGMTAKLQYSTTPGQRGSWIDLPAGTMNPDTSLTFKAVLNHLPPGTYAFRVATTVAGLGTTFSSPSDTFTVLASSPYYEIELDVTSASDPSGVTTHRGDTIDYTVRFRNSGGLAVPTSDEVKILARIPGGTAASATGSSPGYEIIASGADTFAIWTLPRALNPIDAEVAFTVSNAATDVLFSANHGLEDGALLTVKSTESLPGGLAVGTVYQAISTTSNSFKLAIPGSITPVNVLDNGSGTHILKRESVYRASRFTVSSVDDNLLQADNVGLREGQFVTVTLASAGALPGGLSAGTIYRVMSLAEDGFQLAVVGSANPVNILDAGVGNFELKRTDLWQTRTLRVKVDDPLAKDETSVDDLDYGDALRSFARITNRFAGLGGIKDSAPVETILVNPLRLTAGQPVIEGGGPMKQNSFFHVDLTVTNDASYTLTTPFLRVHAPDGLALRKGEFADGVNEPSPDLGEDSEGRQILTFEIGALAPGASRVCRALYRVQYDWPYASHIDYDLATASENRPTATTYEKVPYKAKVRKRERRRGRLVWVVKTVNRFRIVSTSYVRNGLEREIENPYDIDVDEAVGLLKPQLRIYEFENFGIAPAGNAAEFFTEVPEDQKPHLRGIEMIADSTAPVPGTNPPRNSNELALRIDYINSGSVTSEFNRIKIRFNPNVTYVPGSATVRAPDGIINPVPTFRDGYHYFDVPFLDPDEDNSLHLKVKLNPGTPVGTFIFHEKPTILSRLVRTTWTTTRPGLLAISGPPAAMEYKRNVIPDYITNEENEIIGVRRWEHRVNYVNRGGIASNEVGIRYYIPPGLRFERAYFANFYGLELPGLQSRVTAPPANSPSGTVIFNVGQVASKAMGQVVVVLVPDEPNLPARTLHGDQTDSLWECYDSSTSGPTGPRSAKQLPGPKESLLLTSPAPHIRFLSPHPFMVLEGRMAAHIGEQITYQIAVGNSGTDDLSLGFLAVPVPMGATFISYEHVGNDRGNADPHIVLAPLHGFNGPNNNTYAALDLDNHFGCLVVPVSIGVNGSVVVKVTFEMTGNEGSEVVLEPKLVLGSRTIDGAAMKTFRPKASDPVEHQLSAVYSSFMGSAASASLGNADQPNTVFRTHRANLSLDSRTVSVLGADSFQLTNGLVIVKSGARIVAAGGGNVVANDGAGLQSAGAAVVANDGAGFIMTGESSSVTMGIPGFGRGTAEFALNQIANIVAGGGGNIVAAGGGNLTRTAFLLNAPDVILAATLIGQDGAALTTYIERTNGSRAFVMPDSSEIALAAPTPASLAAAVGLIGGDGASLVGQDGAGIVAGGGGNIFFSNRTFYIPLNALIAQGASNIVAAGGGNIVAAGGGNIVAAGGGNFALFTEGLEAIVIGN